MFGRQDGYQCKQFAFTKSLSYLKLNFRGVHKLIFSLQYLSRYEPANEEISLWYVQKLLFFGISIYRRLLLWDLGPKLPFFELF